MLHEFLSANRAELIKRCKGKVARRRAPHVSDAQLEHGIPLFIDQLTRTLRLEPDSKRSQSREGLGARSINTPEIGAAAARHGLELLRHGFTVNQVVHDYGDLCQAVTELAFQYGKPIQIGEFHTLNRCLDNAIADAVTEYSCGRDVIMAEQGMLALNERLGFLAHELRNHLHTACLALSAIKSGKVGLEGATGAALDRSLIELRSLIDRSLADVRVTAGMSPRQQLVSLADFIAEQQISASLEAQARECTLTVSAVDPGLAVEVDKDLLSSAVGNLLQNAFKFTHPHTEVSLNAYAAADRILIEVEDRCGGLAADKAQDMFLSFVQSGEDKSGLGLGLSISRRSVEANKGVLSVRNLPGCGCVFTIDLPRHSMQAPAAVTGRPSIQLAIA